MMVQDRERAHQERSRCRDKMGSDIKQPPRKERSHRGPWDKVRGQRACYDLSSPAYLVERRRAVWERRLEQLGL